MLMLLNKIKKSKLGYTLTELIVVISVLGILAVVATPFISDYVTSAKTNADNANMRMLEDVVKRAVAKGDIIMTGTDASTNDEIIAAVKKEVSTLPKSQVDENKKWVLTRATCTVTLEASTFTATTGTDLIITY